MPTIEENFALWNDQSNWRLQGDEWSVPFGNTEALWSFVIYPRIHRFVPAPRILEIAPGHGRWTQFLRHLCDSLTIVDISPECIEGCRRRFSEASNISYHVNDGMSLDMVPDESVDFAFSFDSLVHVEIDVIQAYIRQLARKLAPQGVAFVHHSNLGAYSGTISMLSRVPKPLHLQAIASRLLAVRLCGRAPSVTAEAFGRICEESGVPCISQELITWAQDRRMIDGLSVFSRKDSLWSKPNHVVPNPSFWRQATAIRDLAGLYTEVP